MHTINTHILTSIK